MINYLINWLITSFLNGLFFFSIFLCLYYLFYLKHVPRNDPDFKQQFEQFQLNENLLHTIKKFKDGMLNPDSNACLAMNMLFQFLFQELKDTKAIRRYIIRKLTFEFKELLTTKAAGKFITRISARDFSLGTSFPVINSIKLYNYELDASNKIIQEMSVILELEYKNGFSVSIDADLILGKSAYTHVKIASLKGKARLQFSRYPFTHWNFCFIEEPELEFDASSQFDGMQIPQLTTLIINQLRRSIRRKHTFPNYKIRFKPFFDKIYDQKLYKSNIDKLLKKEKEPNSLNLPLSNLNIKIDKYQNIQYNKLCDKLGFDLSSVGELIIDLKQCDRLPESLYSLNMSLNQIIAKSNENINMIPKSASSQQIISNTSTAPNNECQKDQSCFIYLTISLDSVSMESLMEKKICKDSWPTIEFEIKKTSLNQQLGINFVEIFFINRTEVCIQKIFPNSIASSVKNLNQFDIVYSINQNRVSSLKHLNKLVQKFALTPMKFVMQRPCIMFSNKVTTSKVSNDNNTNPDLNSVDSKTSTGESNSLTPNDSNPSLARLTSSSVQLLSSISVTHTASASCLVDFFCCVAESPIGEQSTSLDLISLLTNSSDMNCQENNESETQKEIKEKRESIYFNKTKDLKLEKENLFSIMNKEQKPVRIDEAIKFKLNKNTKYLNVFLWTVQYMNKTSKKKNLLIGYISLPVNEISVDCWNTMKGESQTTVYFRPIEEFKASAISKLSKSHVVSDHIGFNPNISLGNLTLNIKHKLSSEEENFPEHNKNNLVNKIGDDLIENNQIEFEMNKKYDLNSLNSNQNSDLLDNQNYNEDTSLHKFLNVQFNQNIACEICNKKIWFKNAYQCAYCGYIIHIKCYEKAINKTICSRFYSKNNPDSDLIKPNNQENQDQTDYVILNSIETDSNDKNSIKSKRSSSPSQLSLSGSESGSRTKNLVNSIFNGIRQRRQINNSTNIYSNTPTATATTTTSSVLSSALSNRASGLFNKLIKVNKEESVRAENFETNQISKSDNENIGNNKNNSFNSSFSAEAEEFKDFDPSEQDKLFGMELFEDLLPDERKLKFKEQIEKYQSTIDMMRKLKIDLEKELDLVLKSNLKSTKPNLIKQQEEHLKGQLRHLDDQIKCVLFLSMQCQLGLDNCNENFSNRKVDIENKDALSLDNIRKITPKIFVSSILENEECEFEN